MEVEEENNLEKCLNLYFTTPSTKEERYNTLYILTCKYIHIRSVVRTPEDPPC